MINWHWYEKYVQESPLPDRIADWAAAVIGSWTFIILQSIVSAVWVGLNVWGWREKWDPYPFVLLNLFFSLQAFYAAPLILMAENRQAARDRIHSHHDREVNLRAKEEIEELQRHLARLETEKLDKIIAMLQQLLPFP
jgi:uncharacterized membrane protein